MSVDQVISLPIKIHNPTDSPFHLEDVFAVESSNADWAEVQLKEDDISDIYIGPGVTETVGNLKVSISEPGEHSGYLHIKTKDVMGDSVPNFVVPLSFSVLRPGLYLPPMIDFGILTSPDTVATLPVPMKNVGQEDLVITGYYSTASALSISPAEDEIIPPQGEVRKNGGTGKRISTQRLVLISLSLSPPQTSPPPFSLAEHHLAILQRQRGGCDGRCHPRDEQLKRPSVDGGRGRR